MAKSNRIHASKGDRILLGFDWAVLLLLGIVIAYPLLFVVSASFTSGATTMSLGLIPRPFSLAGYRAVFEYREIWRGYANSLYYMVLGTVLSLTVTLCCAYPLSREDLLGGGLLMGLCIFTMYFSGGMIPTYLIVRGLGLLNTVWAVVLPSCLSIYNMIVMRTFFKTQIPRELFEASQIDGCGNMRFFLQIALPLSKAILAVIGLFYAVGIWNAYFEALIYLQDRAKFPLTIFMRELLVINALNAMQITDIEQMEELYRRQTVMKYALIVVASLPVMLLYPFVQKHFVTGVMIGAVKG